MKIIFAFRTRLSISASSSFNGSASLLILSSICYAVVNLLLLFALLKRHLQQSVSFKRLLFSGLRRPKSSRPFAYLSLCFRAL